MNRSSAGGQVGRSGNGTGHGRGGGHVCQGLKHEDSRPNCPGGIEWGEVGGKRGSEGVRDGRMAGMRLESEPRL